MLDLTRDAYGTTSLPGSSHPAANGTIPGLDGGGSWADEVDEMISQPM